MRYFSPLNWVFWFGQFVYAWSLSIPWGDASRAVPAVLLLFVLAVATFVNLDDSSGWRSELIDRQLTAAWDTENFDAVVLVLERQLEIRPGNADLIYRLAVAKSYLGDDRESRRIMRTLVDGHGSTAAAKWLLKAGLQWRELVGTR